MPQSAPSTLVDHLQALEEAVNAAEAVPGRGLVELLNRYAAELGYDAARQRPPGREVMFEMLASLLATLRTSSPYDGIGPDPGQTLRRWEEQVALAAQLYGISRAAVIQRSQSIQSGWQPAPTLFRLLPHPGQPTGPTRLYATAHAAATAFFTYDQPEDKLTIALLSPRAVRRKVSVLVVLDTAQRELAETDVQTAHQRSTALANLQARWLSRRLTTSNGYFADPARNPAHQAPIRWKGAATEWFARIQPTLPDTVITALQHRQPAVDLPFDARAQAQEHHRQLDIAVTALFAHAEMTQTPTPKLEHAFALLLPIAENDRHDAPHLAKAAEEALEHLTARNPDAQYLRGALEMEQDPRPDPGRPTLGQQAARAYTASLHSQRHQAHNGTPPPQVLLNQVRAMRRPIAAAMNPATENAWAGNAEDWADAHPSAAVDLQLLRVQIDHAKQAAEQPGAPASAAAALAYHRARLETTFAIHVALGCLTSQTLPDPSTTDDPLQRLLYQRLLEQQITENRDQVLAAFPTLGHARTYLTHRIAALDAQLQATGTPVPETGRTAEASQAALAEREALRRALTSLEHLIHPAGAGGYGFEADDIAARTQQAMTHRPARGAPTAHHPQHHTPPPPDQIPRSGPTP